MSTQYCDVCGCFVESVAAGQVRECGLRSEGSETEDDYGYVNDCPFDNDLTIEDYNEELEYYDDDHDYSQDDGTDD